MHDDGLGAFRGLLFAAAVYLGVGLLWLLARLIGWAEMVFFARWLAVGLALRRAVRARL